MATEPKFNGKPPVSDFNSAYIVCQQALEQGFRTIEFNDLVLKAGANVSESVKITGLSLPSLGDVNKTAEVSGGAAGKTFTWSGGNIIVNGSYGARLFWDGTLKTWSKVDEWEYPKGLDGRDITDWTAKSYNYVNGKGSLVFNSGIIYENNAATVAGDIPGVSNKWVKKINAGQEELRKILDIKGAEVDQNYFAIPHNTAVNASNSGNDGLFFYQNNSLLIGKSINKIFVNIVTAGTLSVFKILNAGSSAYTKTLITTLNVTVGVPGYDVPPFVLNENETLAFFDSTDTCRFRFNNSMPNADGGGLKYITFSSNVWSAFFQRDLSIGVQVVGQGLYSEKIDLIDSNISDLQDHDTNINGILDLQGSEGYITLIPKLVTSPASLAQKTLGMLYYQNNSLLIGKVINKIFIDVATAGTFSILKLTGAATPGFTKVVVEVLNLSLGQTEYNLATPLILQEGETIAFSDQGDIGNFRYSAAAVNPVGGGFRFYTFATSSWSGLSNQDINIGIATEAIVPASKRLDDIEVALNNKIFSNKKISFLGDSITSYAGYIPTGNAHFYPSNNVTNVEMTWWKKLLNITGGVLSINNSWSGSFVSSNGGAVSSFQNRLNLLGTPDVIFIFGGTNDFNGNVPLGDIDFATEFDLTQFTDAYCNVIQQVSVNYPNAMIYCMTPLKRGANGIVVTKNSTYSVDQMCDRIIDIAKIYGVNYIDTRRINITPYNRSNYLFDALHPNSSGMELLVDFIKRNL
ncbi:hypothetical protein J5U18_12800 [Sphingobacteriaceae bacterium WQ 2009]|uniref:SGNH hydrolase-type esterase domain-containing protein n=1 Tax=Rhinopithecimicrobium faecis TaxID=2820698 RepID=A0A8T4HBD8_9SPHI|nr:hypothetical protein [Sphingobacteriaceae bacterium WQ 2009]